MATFHKEARALYQVLVVDQHLNHLPDNVRESAYAAILAAEERFEALMREHKGYWKGDVVMHGSRGPFVVESFTGKEGLADMCVVLRPLKADGTPSAKLTWEYLDTNLTRVTK